MGSAITRLINALRDRDDGSTISEYAILAALIGVALVGLIVALAGPLAELFTATAEGFDEGS
jgi:Flp pilus assembly pilin Flp